ncbi:PRC-barrel domain-containing protein [Fulvimarina sp. 2208YS6-2-32]|uniref:PRC-barrel domain-containing protein n=1 Tax=Fulvimarina uroteuthidis TaxID=3098149 RepID=A0ABU5HZZ5_9HYPH|nr:PRC-barrel domain-containing protein [Fulvimarina sp. 2208YS6-2-32]MDY8108355.1 PRC-barrel domain-containing protein [Fulvimarina sp. 2208YS6-2-32]
MNRFATTAAFAFFATTALAQDPATPPPPAPPAADAAPATPPETPESPAGQPPAGANAMVLVPIDRDDAPVPPLNLMVDQVEELTVIGADDEVIGEVDDVLGDQNGQPQAIVVEAGGFLGLGEKRIILMLNQLSLDMGRLRTALTKNEISSLPEYPG